MQRPFICDQTFNGIDYTQNSLPKGEYENCTFQNCRFSEGFLDNQNFMECEFVECDLTNANIKHTVFKECFFKDSKLIGLRFEDCDKLLFSVNFDTCNIGLASFFELSPQKTQFVDCTLKGADFTEADLTASVFTHCNLENAVFYGTILEKVDFTTSFNLNINPEENRMKGAKFSKDNLIGLLKKYDIVIT